MELLFQLFLLVVVRKRKRSFQQCWIFCCFAQLSGAVIRPTYLGFLATRSQANDFDNGARFGKCCRIDLRKCHFFHTNFLYDRPPQMPFFSHKFLVSYKLYVLVRNFGGDLTCLKNKTRVSNLPV